VAALFNSMSFALLSLGVYKIIKSSSLARPAYAYVAWAAVYICLVCYLPIGNEI